MVPERSVSHPAPSPESVGWLAAYLYYGEPWETFLTKAIQPFVEKIKIVAEIEQFFFVRYWERGPHIRLRFKGKQSTLEQVLKPALWAYFTNYFQQHPSRRTESDRALHLTGDQQWCPNNSIQFVLYEPETERYGGPVGILIAEQQFEASSRAVLSAITESVTWDYTRALGTAVHLHLGFAHAMGMNLADAAIFFNRCFQGWFPRSYHPLPQRTHEEEPSLRQAVYQAFEASFTKHRELLIALFRKVWSALEENQDFEQQWFHQWLMEMRQVNQRLVEAQVNAQRQLPPGVTGGTQDQHQRWYIFDSYVHMTNNRLGILNRDEGYLGYLLKEGFSELVRHSQEDCFSD